MTVLIEFEAPPEFDRSLFDLPGYYLEIEENEEGIAPDPGNNTYRATLTLRKGCGWLTEDEVSYYVNYWGQKGIMIHQLVLEDDGIRQRKH